MILVDFSQIMVSNLMVMIARNEYDPIFFRHWVLNSLRQYNVKFRGDYGEMTICCDSPSWRRDYFPHYKMNRKKKRAADDIDWDSVFQNFNETIEMIEDNFPYKVLRVDKSEADDIIAVSVKNFRETSKEPVLIISSDKDFMQLKKHGNVKQYCPRNKNFINEITDLETIHDNLLVHIITGDTSDGIPNIFSDDDSLVNEEKKQNRATKKRVEEVKNDIKSNNINKYSSAISRNTVLIDLDKIPQDVVSEILEHINKDRKGNMQKCFSYLMKNHYKELIKRIDDFQPLKYTGE
jgi:5'-3' exonuclease